VFAPDAVDERGIHVVIHILGSLDHDQPTHKIPALTAEVGSRVHVMDAASVIAFHRGEDGTFMAGYQPRLSQANDAVLNSLMLGVIDAVAPAFPEQADLVGVLRANLAWQTAVAPMRAR
jgi:hypothetical protein